MLTWTCGPTGRAARSVSNCATRLSASGGAEESNGRAGIFVLTGLVQPVVTGRGGGRMSVRRWALRPAQACVWGGGLLLWPQFHFRFRQTAAGRRRRGVSGWHLRLRGVALARFARPPPRTSAPATGNSPWSVGAHAALGPGSPVRHVPPALGASRTPPVHPGHAAFLPVALRLLPFRVVYPRLRLRGQPLRHFRLLHSARRQTDSTAIPRWRGGPR